MADPGEGLRGPGHPLFLDQTEAQRAEKNFFGELRTPHPPLSQGMEPHCTAHADYVICNLLPVPSSNVS